MRSMHRSCTLAIMVWGGVVACRGTLPIGSRPEVAGAPPSLAAVLLQVAPSAAVTIAPLEISPAANGLQGWEPTALGARTTAAVLETLRRAGYRLAVAGEPTHLTVRTRLAILWRFKSPLNPDHYLRAEAALSVMEGEKVVEEVRFENRQGDALSEHNFPETIAARLVSGLSTSRALANYASSAPRTVAPTARLPEAAGQAAERPQLYAAGGRIAILDFRNFAAGITKENVQYFADLVRGVTLEQVPRMKVMTRENLLVLLKSSGRELADCEGECEVDTGRRIGADAIVSGDIQKVGTRFKLSLRLHDTADGQLVSSAIASGKSIDELDDALRSAAATLLKPLR